MRDGEKFENDQAEMVLSDGVIDWIAENIEDSELDGFFQDLSDLFVRPWGKHPLSNRNKTDNLAGLNTATTLGGEHRIVFRSYIDECGTGVIRIIAIGPRKDNRVYDAINALVASGKLTEEEVRSIWEALSQHSHVTEKYGLEQWDYLPPLASPNMVKVAVTSGVLSEDVARLLSTDELNAAFENGWDLETGKPDPRRAQDAALSKAATSASPERILTSRSAPRCAVFMPIAKAKCIRRRGHPGAHRSVN